METHKKQLIDQYLLPALGNLSTNGLLTAHFYELIKLSNAIKHQLLELPGSGADGQLWFPIHSVTHCYTYNKLTGKRKGSRIYKRRQFIFNVDSLVDHDNRIEYIEILEPGEVLHITYPALWQLMADFSDLQAAMNLLCHLQGKYSRQQELLLKEEPLERVRRFHQERPEFIRCASQERQAMHLGFSLRMYVYHLKQLRNIAR